MGGVGFTELLLLAVVALIVLGPERLPTMARTAGRLTRQARRAWQGLQSELQSELDADHNRRIMDATSGRDVKPAADEPAKPDTSDESTVTGDLVDTTPEAQSEPQSKPQSDPRSEHEPGTSGDPTEKPSKPKRDDDAS